ncbi:MAG: sulfotransferase family protein [Ardenticatenaceae bacterium]
MKANRELLHQIYPGLMRWVRWVRWERFFGYPLNRRENVCPFFIVGSGRCGTTLLRRILYGHPKLHIPPENHVMGKTIKLFHQYRKQRWDVLVYLALSRLALHAEFETFEIRLLPLARKLVNTPPNQRSLAFIFDQFYRYHADSKGKMCKRWGDKTPLNIFFLPHIRRVFPDAQFIHLYRDGCDVIASFLKMKRYQKIEDAAKRWKRSIQAGKRFTQQHPRACLEIRYETLVTQPEKTVRTICDFLGITYYDSMIDSSASFHSMGDTIMRSHHHHVAGAISTESIGKGRRAFTMNERMKLHELIEHDLLQLGYTSCLV